MSNPTADDLSLEDKVSYVGPEWGPTGRDDASYEPDDDDENDVEDVTPAADDASEASSAFSLPADTVDVSRLLDLSDDRRFCLVRMTKRNGSVQTACVCGNPAGGCRRSGHNAKKSLGSATAVAQPGYYQECIDSKGNPSGVGLTNERWFTVDEYRQLQREQARNASKPLSRTRTLWNLNPPHRVQTRSPLGATSRCENQSSTSDRIRPMILWQPLG